MIYFSILLCLVQPKFQDFTGLEFFNLLVATSHAVVIDVQVGEEFEVCHIIKSIHAPTKAEILSITDTLGKDNAIFVYCLHGKRSQSAANLLVENGFLNVVNLKEGLNGFVADSAAIQYHNYLEYKTK